MKDPAGYEELAAEIPAREKWPRRAWLGAAGGAVLSAAGGGWLYSLAPSFWHRYAEDLQRPIDPAPHVPRPKAWPASGLHAAWIGHATVLLSLDGCVILTDPNFSDWAGFHFGPFSLGIKREVAPALKIRDLPPVDLILLSHAHMDHFDLPSLARLENRRTTVITAERTADLLNADGYGRVVELPWDETVEAGAVKIRAVHVKHWGARVRTDTYRRYNGYVIESRRFRVLFGGDTAYTDAFAEIKGSSEADLALMPIACYNPYHRSHCTPEEAWKMAADAGARRFLPIHHSTFLMSAEPPREPMERLLRAADGDHALDKIVIRSIGQEWHAS